MVNKHSTLKRVEKCLLNFLKWFSLEGLNSYDQWDLWATAYGVWSKGIYYRYGAKAVFPVIPLALMDWLVPSIRKFVRPKTNFPIADSHYIMGFLAMYGASNDRKFLEKAKDIAEHLMDTSITGFSGYCWGYPFDWQTKRGLVKSGTPLITTTPYAFYAFNELYESTGESRYLDVVRSIAQFIANDIQDTHVESGSAASYTPYDSSQVINASAYRAACLMTAYKIFGEDRYREIAEKNTNFVVTKQRSNGSWYYSGNDKKDAFVDHIHTCFVLKGLYQIYRLTDNTEIFASFKKGFDYYRENLFDHVGVPKTFSEAKNKQFKVVELYDYAEAINLFIITESSNANNGMLHRLVSDLLNGWQTAEGFFVSRISKGGLRNMIPYHRWGQSQIFRSLALYYNEIKR